MTSHQDAIKELNEQMDGVRSWLDELARWIYRLEGLAGSDSPLHPRAPCGANCPLAPDNRCTAPFLHDGPHTFTDKGLVYTWTYVP